MASGEASKVAWNPQLEKVLAQEAERCLCYSVLHRLCEQRYSKLNNFIALPVIVLSTLAGTASVGSSALFGDSPVSALAIGGVSITVGVLNTLGSYFGWARRAEGHKSSYVHYGKLHRFLMIELSLPPDQRMSASDLLKTMRDQVRSARDTADSTTGHCGKRPGWWGLGLVFFVLQCPPPPNDKLPPRSLCAP